LCSDSFGSFSNERVTLISYGEDISYSDNLLNSLSQIDSKQFILINEDALLCEDISTARFEEVISIFINEDMHYLKFFVSLPYALQSEFGIPFGSIQPGTKYRVSCSFVIWNTPFLKQFLIPGESAWDIEILGSPRSDIFPDGFYAPTVRLKENPLIHLVHGVVKGKWTREAQKYLRTHNMSKHLKYRGKITYYQEHVRHHMYNILPITKVKKILRTFFDIIASKLNKTEKV